MKFSRNISITIICIILGIMLSWQYKSIESNKRVSASQTKTCTTFRKNFWRKKRTTRICVPETRNWKNSWRSISMRRETINRLKKV